VKGFGTMILSINGGEGLEPGILEKNIVYIFERKNGRGQFFSRIYDVWD
jgi:hypothetical protein